MREISYNWQEQAGGEFLDVTKKMSIYHDFRLTLWVFTVNVGRTDHPRGIQRRENKEGIVFQVPIGC